jgi:hypothetical protein
MIRVPGMRAGLNERSQSAYAMPAPKPVESAIGHVRPEGKGELLCGVSDGQRESRTSE